MARLDARAAAPGRPPENRTDLAAFRVDARDARTLAPLPGASVAVSDTIDLLGPSAGPPRRDPGGLHLAPPLSGRWWLHVHHDGYLPEVVEVAPGAPAARVLLHRPASLRVRLRGPGGEPLDGLRLRALCHAAVDAAEETSDGAGAVRLEGLRPGRWLLVPHADRRHPPDALPAAAVALGGGSRLEVDLRAGSGRACVRVHALDERGRPCTGQLLLVPGAGEWRASLDELLSRGPVLAARGGLAFHAVPPGPWTVYLVRERGSGEPDVRAFPIEVGDRDLRLELHLRGPGGEPAARLGAAAV